MGRGVGRVDLELLGQVDDAQPDELDEQIEVAGVLIGPEFEGRDAILEAADAPLDVDVG